jgi:hypothetical protein
VGAVGNIAAFGDTLGQGDGSIPLLIGPGSPDIEHYGLKGHGEFLLISHSNVIISQAEKEVLTFQK